MQELDRVKREISKLQREVKSAREAVAKAEQDAEAPTPSVTSADSRVQGSGVKPEAGEANEERVVAELDTAGGLGDGAQVQATWTRAEGIIHNDTSDATESFATASRSEVENEGSSLSLRIKKHQEHHDASLQAAAEAELSSARTELASVKEEEIRFADSTELERGSRKRSAGSGIRRRRPARRCGS
jgi:hypothetical protein